MKAHTKRETMGNEEWEQRTTGECDPGWMEHTHTTNKKGRATDDTMMQEDTTNEKPKKEKRKEQKVIECGQKGWQKMGFKKGEGLLKNKGIKIKQKSIKIKAFQIKSFKKQKGALK